MSKPTSDPYIALGVSKDADLTTIKATYRKLVIKCHPDKVLDESLKAQKAEEFHKIQEAYELLADDEKRKEYDASVRLAQLKKEAFDRGSSGPRGAEPRGSYGVRTAVPAEFKSSSRSYEDSRESRPRSYDDDNYDSKKYDEYYHRRTTSGRPRERDEPKASRERETERARAERKKTRERDERRDRSSKYATVEEEDSYDRYKKRSQEEVRSRAEEDRRHADDLRRRGEDLRRHAEEPRSHKYRDEYPDEHSRKLTEKYTNATEYIIRRSGTERPAVVRRSSARPKESGRDRERERDRDRERERERERERDAPIREPYRRRGSYDEGPYEDRRPPTLQPSHSSPASIKIPRTSPQRAQTFQPGYFESRDQPPVFRRSETMPSMASATSPTSRRDKGAPLRSSTLRESSFPADSGYSSPGTPEYVTSPKYTTYTTTSGPGPKVVYVEPPSSRPKPTSRATTSSSSRHAMPGLQRSSTARSPDPLYGELRRGPERDHDHYSSSSRRFDDIQYAPKINPENIRYGYREDFDRPGTLHRSATAVN